MIKSLKRPSPLLDPLPLCTNVYNYGNSSGGGGGSSGTLTRLVPASDVGFSSSGNTIGVLNRNFVPSRITNPTRLLLGFPTSINVPYDSTTPIPLKVTYSTSADVDLVTQVELNKEYKAGSAGFYFRNEVPSDYYFMIGSFAGTNKLSQRVMIVAVPQGVSPSEATVSSIPGFVANFRLLGHFVGGGSHTATPNTYFNVGFSLAAPVAVGALQPLVDGSELRFGDYVPYGGSQVTYTPRIEELTYVCYS